MCMIEGADEMVLVLGSHQRRARKEHRCMECGRMIQPGETYLNEGTLFESRKATHKTCAHCLVARQWLAAECGGWLYEGVSEDIREHAMHWQYGFGVMRLAVGTRNRWRRKDGRLWPVPRMPKTSFDKMKAAA